MRVAAAPAPEGDAVIGELSPEVRQGPVPQLDPVAGAQRLANDGLPIYSARRFAAQIDVDVLVTLVTADLRVAGGQPLQAQVRVRPAADDGNARHQIELMLAGMLRRGVAERENQARPAAAPRIMCGHHHPNSSCMCVSPRLPSPPAPNTAGGRRSPDARGRHPVGYRAPFRPSASPQPAAPSRTAARRSSPSPA